MYFFLDSRAKGLNAMIKRAFPVITVYKKAVAAEIDAAKNQKRVPNPSAVKAQETAIKLGAHLRNFTKTNDNLSVYTQNVSGLLSSFFFPWSKAFQYRKEAATYLRKAENKFNKFTNLVNKHGR